MQPKSDRRDDLRVPSEPNIRPVRWYRVVFGETHPGARRRRRDELHLITRSPAHGPGFRHWLQVPPMVAEACREVDAIGPGRRAGRGRQVRPWVAPAPDRDAGTGQTTRPAPSSRAVLQSPDRTSGSTPPGRGTHTRPSRCCPLGDHRQAHQPRGGQHGGDFWTWRPCLTTANAAACWRTAASSRLSSPPPVPGSVKRSASPNNSSNTLADIAGCSGPAVCVPISGNLRPTVVAGHLSQIRPSFCLPAAAAVPAGRQ